ncbi:MAG: LamG domain-containing protein, partial [Planctomycetota bacterium]
MKRLLMIVLTGIFVVGCQDEAVVEKPVQLQAEPKPIINDTSVGLVGLWKFDEVSGTMVADSSGKGRNGTLMEEANFGAGSVEGAIGKALFLKDNQYVQINGYKGVLGTQARTVCAWIKTKHTKGKLLSWGLDEGGKQFNFTHHRGRIGIRPKGGYYYMNDKLNDESWHHVAAVILDSESPNLHDDVRLYKDGELAIIHDIGVLDLWPIDTKSGEDVTIGKGYQGAIDDVRIYDRAL